MGQQQLTLADPTVNMTAPTAIITKDAIPECRNP